MMNKYKSIYLPFVLMTLGIVALAQITFAQTQEPNIVFNKTGIYIEGEKAYVRSADVVVCRGTNLLDDIIKTFTCDIVCYSWDNDCSDEIQKAIDRVAKKGGGVVYIKSGEYPIISAIRINNDTILIGDGIDNTILKGAGIYKYSDSYNDIIKNIYIEGMTIEVLYNSTYGLYIPRCNNCILKNLKLVSHNNDTFIIHWGSSNNFYANNIIVIRNSTFDSNTDVIAGSQNENKNGTSIWENVWIYVYKGGGGFTTGSSGNLIVRNLYYVDSRVSSDYQDRAMSFEAIDNKGKKIILENIYIECNNPALCSISCGEVGTYGYEGCILKNIFGYSIFCRADVCIIENANVSKGIIIGSGSQKVIIKDSIIQNDGGSCIIQASGDSIISNNIIGKCLNHGIDISGGKAKIEGNKIYDVSYLSNGIYSGIVLRTQNNTIINNEIYSSNLYEKYCIEEKTGASYNYISNNICNDPDGIYLVSAKSYSDSYIYSSLPTCNAFFNGRTITYYNGAAYFRCTCIEGSWKCVQLG